MFNEHDIIALIAPVPLENTWHLSDHSPLHKTIREKGKGLLPSDIGVIIHIYKQGEAFEVEFVLPDGCPAAIATVYPHQMRPATEEDLANDRFWQDAPDNEESECSMSLTPSP